MFEDYAEMCLWRQWAMYSVTDRLNWVSKQVRSIDNTHPVITHVGGCSVIQDVVGDSSDDRANAKTVDFYGSSFPVSQISSGDTLRMGMINDWIRSVSKYYWINEIYANTPNWGRPDLPEDIRFRVWRPIAHGAQGLLFWQYKNERFGTESNGYGLVNIDGSDTDRSEEAQRIAKVINKNKDILYDSAVEKAEVALIYDIRSDVISRLEETNSKNFSTNWNAGFGGTTKYRYKNAIKGVYSIFEELNVPIDWLSISDIEKIKDYKMVYIAYPVVMDKKTAKVLENYVKEGGVLISEASIGVRQENTWVSPEVPGCGLEELFGLKEVFRLIDKEKDISIPDINAKILSSKVTAKLDVDNAEIIASWEDDNTPAVTINQYGKGKAIYIATYPSISYLNNKDDSILKLFKFLAKKAGVSSPISVSGVKGKVVIRSLRKQDKRLVFVFNYEDYEQNVIIKGHSLCRNLELVPDMRVKESKEGISFTIPSKQVVCMVVIRNTEG